MYSNLPPFYVSLIQTLILSRFTPPSLSPRYLVLNPCFFSAIKSSLDRRPSCILGLWPLHGPWTLQVSARHPISHVERGLTRLCAPLGSHRPSIKHGLQLENSHSNFGTWRRTTTTLLGSPSPGTCSRFLGLHHHPALLYPSKAVDGHLSLSLSLFYAFTPAYLPCRTIYNCL